MGSMIWFVRTPFHHSENQIPDKGDSIVRNILTDSLEDSEDSVTGLAVLAVWGANK